ncbi:MAG: FAD-dependent oxidoreductase, partial [Firmicutes bacterium]|nr:FAD-dependent oxidoreductase [Bacillota bacterium]
LKYAYAIEYDAVVPTQFDSTLQVKAWPGLYCAGQIVGTSGYEEAAGLGLMAGINAVLKIRDQRPLILRRDEAYIGVMIDDLVTKGTKEPYRLMSSRAEYRLLMRHDNADLRLTEKGYHAGLISPSRYEQFVSKIANLDKAMKLLETSHLGNKPELISYLNSLGFDDLKGGISGIELLRRQEVKYDEVRKFIPSLQNIDLDKTAIEQLEIMIKFEGYIAKQKKEALSMAKLEDFVIPQGLNYKKMDGLALEARQKLNTIQPLTVGQASRISGVNPSDISILLLYLRRGVKNDS